MDEPLEVIAGKVVALIKKGEDAKEKSEQYYKAAGLYLVECQQRKPVGVPWGIWCSEHIKISSRRAYELMQIGRGVKTVAEMQASNAASHKKSRDLKKSAGHPAHHNSSEKSTTLKTITWYLKRFDQAQLDRALDAVKSIA